MYGYYIVCRISKGTFEIALKISDSYLKDTIFIQC